MDITRRRQSITTILEEKGYVSVEALVKVLGVSAVTVRSDLTSLEDMGVLMRTHGGAMRLEKKSAMRDISQTMVEFEAQKKAIANRASELVPDGGTVVIDSGSTTIHMVEHLKGKGLSVITNSIPVVASLKDDDTVTLYAIGGQLRKESMGFVGPIANNTIKSVNVDIYFMGAASVTKDTITSSSLLEAELKRCMMDSADKVVLLADSSKFGRKSFSTVCSWDRIDTFVTDSIDPEFRASLEEMGVEVLTVND